MLGSRAAIDRIGLVAILVGFALPLLSRLIEPEMRSDEAIYSYAAERIVDTGNWLTPRYIPTDNVFLEKPPLKLWLVAAGIKLGLLPRDESGLRFFDGLFGAIGFFYVYLYARRLAGVGGGVVAALVLFTLEPLAFDHGLRSANMESAVFLCYCGGVYHFGRWVETAGREARGHAWAVTAWFVLGFMTKFVAAFFLPVVAAVALGFRPAGLRLAIDRSKEWLAPAAAALVVCAPWFIYQSWLHGALFWNTIFSVHVYQRFTTFVDATHLNPWHYYVSTTWREILHAGSAIAILAGLARLVYVAWRGTEWLARLAVVWAVVPVVLISLGSSKLPHYAYPFWPPLGIGAGMAFVWALGHLDRRVGSRVERALVARLPARIAGWSQQSAGPRRVLLGIALALAALAAVTLAYGPLRFDVGDVTIFRNSSVLRPLFFSVVLAWIGGYSRSLVRLVGVTAVALLLPLSAYAHKLERLSRIDHPIREMRDCMVDVKASGVPVGAGVLAASGWVFHHGYYFYLWRIGPYVQTETFSAEQTLARLTRPGEQTPVLIARADYDTLMAGLPPEGSPADDQTARDLRSVLKNHSIRFDDNIAAIFPGPFRPCATRLIAKAGRPIWPDPAPRRAR
jgi:4-amino-4-deoxy-L-arabinose transferase-like glycosyltransferase